VTEGVPAFRAVARRPPADGARRRWQEAVLARAWAQTPTARTLRLQLSDWTPHVAGQHYIVRLTAPDGYTAQRSYSITSAPEDAGFAELTIERLSDGEVSPYLHDVLEPGDRLEVRGPFGGYFVWRADRPALLIGGGSGVAPLVSMLRHWRGVGRPVPMRLLVSARSSEELWYGEEYGDETTIVYTRQAPPGWPRSPARLRREDLDGVLLPGATAYVCGSHGFAEHASQLLVQLGHPTQDIRVERFGPS